MVLKLILLFTTLLSFGPHAEAKGLSSLEALIDSQYKGEDVCIQKIRKDYLTFKSCIDVGNRASNTVVDVVNLVTFGTAQLSKKSPYTNCKASKSLEVHYRHSGEESVLRHKITKTMKVKFKQGRVAKQTLVKRIKADMEQLVTELSDLPNCDSSTTNSLISRSK